MRLFAIQSNCQQQEKFPKNSKSVFRSCDQVLECYWLKCLPMDQPELFEFLTSDSKYVVLCFIVKTSCATTLDCLDQLDSSLELIMLFNSQFYQPEEDYLAKDWMVVERRGGLRQTTVTSGGANDQTNKRTEIQMRLAGGIGISLINGVPEELVFATFSPIEVSVATGCMGLLVDIVVDI